MCARFFKISQSESNTHHALREVEEQIITWRWLSTNCCKCELACPDYARPPGWEWRVISWLTQESLLLLSQVQSTPKRHCNTYFFNFRNVAEELSLEFRQNKLWAEVLMDCHVFFFQMTWLRLVPGDRQQIASATRKRTLKKQSLLHYPLSCFFNNYTRRSAAGYSTKKIEFVLIQFIFFSKMRTSAGELLCVVIEETRQWLWMCQFVANCTRLSKNSDSWHKKKQSSKSMLH